MRQTRSNISLRALFAASLMLCFLVGAPVTGHAQDEDEGDGPSGATIVRSRAPEEKRPVLVRSKFFFKKGRLEITPRFGYISNNALNSEIMLGVGLTYHFSDRIGLEVAGDYALLGGTGNTKNLAIAVLRLLDPGFRLESVDPTIFATVSLIWYPMYGKLNPFSTAVINLDFFFVVGLGYGAEQIEMLAYDTSTGVEAASMGQAPQLNHLLVGNVGFGAKIYLTKWMSLRLDGRLYLTWDQVLNFDEEEAANTNRQLGSLANRLTCDDASIDPSEKACKVVFPTNFVLSAGLSFWLPGDKAARRRGERRR